MKVAPRARSLARFSDMVSPVSSQEVVADRFSCFEDWRLATYFCTIPLQFALKRLDRSYDSFEIALTSKTMLMSIYGENTHDSRGMSRVSG